MSFHVPNEYRLREHPKLASDDSYGNNGMFVIPASLRRPFYLACQASDGDGWEHCGFPPPPWEHVSVSTKVRCPTWEEMCFVKELFWDAEDVVIQLHPPRSEWVNYHPYTLHLWRPIGFVLPRPPALTVGPA